MPLTFRVLTAEEIAASEARATAWEATCEQHKADVNACPGHQWTLSVYEDPEDGDVHLTCDRCPATGYDLCDDLWEYSMTGVVIEDPELCVEDLRSDPDSHRGKSWPVDVKIHSWQYYEGDWDSEVDVSPRSRDRSSGE